MHSIPLDEDPLPPGFPGEPGPDGAPPPPPVEVEVLGDLRGHVLAGRFVLVELLGSGELGCVYSGRDQASGQQVTVKVLASPEQREVVARIAERARRRLGVRHPCVAAVLAEGTMGGLWYAVMEQAPGKNLYHAEDDARFQGAGLLALAAELGEGLATLHALGAPHGAISAHNLVWSDAGVKLVDLDVHLTAETANEEPSAWADVSALARVILELAAVREDEAPWLAAVARVARGELRPTAAEWAGQLRAAEIEALRPQVVAAATHGEGVIDSAWDALFDETGGPGASASVAPVVDDGLHDIEPPAQLAMVSFEVESTPPSPPPAKAEPAKPEPAKAEPAKPEPVKPEPAKLEPAKLALATPVLAETSAPLAAGPIVMTASSTIPGSLTASLTSPSAAAGDEVWTAAEGTTGRKNMQVALGLLAFAVVCALLGWRLQAWATADSDPDDGEQARPDERPQAPAEPAAAAVTAAIGPRADLSSGTATLAGGGAEATPAAPAPDAGESLADATGEGDLEGDATAGGFDQLSAADFRRILLRTNRSPRVRACYERHGGAGRDDVELVALIGRSGRVQKLRMGEDPLAECLRKIVVRLEFPGAERQAQHNYVFHRPAEDG